MIIKSIKNIIFGISVVLASTAFVGFGTVSVYASECVTLTVANEGTNLPLTSFIGSGKYKPGKKARVESKTNANKSFYGFWEIKTDSSGLYEKKFSDKELETEMAANRELVPDCADHYSVNYSGANVCTGTTSKPLYHMSIHRDPRTGAQNTSWQQFANVQIPSGVVNASSISSQTRCMNSAFTTSRSGYYKIVTGTYTNNSSDTLFPEQNNNNAISAYGGKYSYQTQGSAASFSPNPIPAGTRGNKTVNVS